MELIWQDYVLRAIIPLPRGTFVCETGEESLRTRLGERGRQKWERDSVPVSVPKPSTVHPL